MSDAPRKNDKRPPAGSGAGKDWELWDRVAETVRPMDRSLSPLARARQRSLNSSANAGEAGTQQSADEASNRAAMEAHMGMRSATVPPRPGNQPTKTKTKAPDAAPTMAPPPAFLPAWQPPMQTRAKTTEPIDRKTKRKLSKGALGIDARIDLHGMTQDEAHNALIGFIGMSQARGHRMVLVITGKGLSKQGQGILRRMVPRWLVTPPLAQWVNGHDVSAAHHGGDGALYVRLRRKPSISAL
ncbi:MAG: Smr/MutS family protein [Pseudomonadota bacterium]